MGRSVEVEIYKKGVNYEFNVFDRFIENSK